MNSKNIDFTENSTIADVISNTAFRDFGYLLFPIDREINNDMTLADISSSNIFIWYTNIKCKKTVEIVNYLKNTSQSGQNIFYHIYSKEEMATDPTKQKTGIFFFKGELGEKFAIMNAGGGFLYVGAMHDSFPQALEVSKFGYNCFALIYRPSYAYNDLAKAICYIYDHAKELQVDTQCYSLWGGSAGAKMAAELGKAGAMNYYGRTNISQAGAVIMQYTSYTKTSVNDAPTFACIGTKDCAASWISMRDRLNILNSYGIPTEFHCYEGLSHGFGLGTETIADGWINDAVLFWENNMR